MKDHVSAHYLNSYADTIIGLHDRWTPHAGQWPVIDSVFNDGVRSIFVRCGRKWGKTEIALYMLWRVAQSYPRSPCYYFAPMQNQAKAILWEDPRIKLFGPREWLLDGSRGISEGEMVLRFKNGSFIKIDGTDNYNKYRGPRYKIAIYDEYKDCDPKMRHAMRPNAAVLSGIDVYMGSPPDVPNTDYRMLDDEHELDPEMRAFHAPTWANPHISRKWLYDEKTKLYRRGEGDQWEREYGAKYIKGGASSIFPMLEDRMVKKHEDILWEIRKDLRKLEWYWWADPAGASCFAVLFVAINPYTKKIYVLDEIYETDQKRMTVNVIGKEIQGKRKELNERADWREGYDEAATWFANEWVSHFPDEEGLEPSYKAKHNKMDGITLIKDIMLADLLVISSRCKKFFWEVENYVKDKNGNIPKKDDHLIDDFRYILGAAAYEVPPREEYREEVDEMFRGEALRFKISNPYEEG